MVLNVLQTVAPMAGWQGKAKLLRRTFVEERVVGRPRSNGGRVVDALLHESISAPVAETHCPGDRRELGNYLPKAEAV